MDDRKTKPAFIIAATSSGCGKTTLSLGLMRALVRRNQSIQPFKCGPDYIDTQFQSIAADRESINLDLFMASEHHVRALFSHYSKSADISIIEGVMGMFDGVDNMKGSSADLALTLNIPVVLLINASSTAYSVAATIFGFTRFCPDVKVAGVIFNKVSSHHHFTLLKKACHDVGVDCFGYIPAHKELQTPSRHLGLTLATREEMNRFIDKAADEVENNVDIDRLLQATSSPVLPGDESIICATQDLTVAVARDEAFSFIYPANLMSFGKTTFFSPLHDAHLPEADLVYLPGGYPELYADKLAANRQMRDSIKIFAKNGGRILAECGGLIYLCEEIDGRKMCGVFNLKATMNNSRLTLGYRTIEFRTTTLNGHEFHYSHIIDPTTEKNIVNQRNAKGEPVDTPVYRYKNTVAGYTHLYWAETDILKLWD